jgi:hypothetical protein
MYLPHCSRLLRQDARVRTAIAIATLLLGTQVARAERSTVINLGGMLGGIEHRVDEATRMQPAGGPRLTLSFEHPPPKLDGRVDVTFVPELIAGAVMDATRGEAMVGVGARGEVRLKYVARMAFYLAGRMLLVGSDQDPAGEASLGEYIYIYKRLRFGGEANLMFRKTDELMNPSQTQHVIMVQAYLGWAM